MADEKFLSLDSLAQGAGVELFNDELEKVLQNILDPNTKPTAVRSVTLTFSIKPDEDRTYGASVIDVKSKLAPVKGVGMPIYIGKHAGKAVATERDQRQMAFEDNVTQMTAEKGKAK
jgi:hypothetical protein